MPFDSAKYSHSELKSAYIIFADLLVDMSNARIHTMQQLVRENGLTSDESHRLALEIGTLEVIKETVREELDLKDVDIEAEDE